MKTSECGVGACRLAVVVGSAALDRPDEQVADAMPRSLDPTSKAEARAQCGNFPWRLAAAHANAQ